jgi:hypothetical protein
MFRRFATALACLALGCGGSIGDGPGIDGGADESEDDGRLDFIPSNVPIEHLLVGTAEVILEEDAVIDTGTGEVLSAGGDNLLPADSIFVIVPQGEGPELAVFSWGSFEVAEGVTVTARGERGLVIALRHDARIAGSIDVGGGLEGANLPGPGGFAGGDDDDPVGRGPGGGQALTGRDAGGGGGGYGAPGGDGGLHEGDNSAAAGVSYGAEINSPLLGGSGGGRGGANADGGDGGGGGGAIQISARGEIAIEGGGGINAGGGGGVGGDNDRGGGGGGAGGAILLEAQSLVVAGVLAANGGGGGAGANDNDEGAPGARGVLTAEPVDGGAGDGEGSGGGAGAAADTMAGGPGEATNGNSGGGGGGGGRIFLRTRDGEDVAEAILTPSGAVATGVL